jgi:hypothetical protein
MRDGDEIRLVGSGGAPFLTTVGRPFSKADIQRRLGTGEWSWPGETPLPSSEDDDDPAEQAPDEPSAETAPQGEGGQASKPDPDRPPQSAPKADWAQYVARTLHMSREDAENYTKADLIDMVS